MNKSPQLEDGYTKIANEIIDALCAYRVPGEQMQCLFFIIRKTYGYGKKEDYISNSQFCEATGLHKGNVSRALRELSKKQLVVKSDNKRVSSYRFNKNYCDWKLLSKKQPVVKSDTLVVKSDNKPPSKMTDTKERKKLLQKRVAKSVLFFLNKKAKKRFTTNKTNLKNILGRLADGFTGRDCGRVILNQIEDKYFVENPKFLNPETLFRPSNFEKYLNNTGVNTQESEWGP